MTGAEPTPVLAVFVPGLMGAGILLSGAILVADGVRRLLPNRGVRRRLMVARGVQGVVATLARAAGYEVRDGDLRQRVPRSRVAYLVTGAALATLGGVLIRVGVDAYTGPGTLHTNPWAIGLGVGGAVPLLVGAALALALAALRRRAPRLLRWLVGSTWLGRLRTLPEDPGDRVRLLIPGLQGGEER